MLEHGGVLHCSYIQTCWWLLICCFSFCLCTLYSYHKLHPVNKKQLFMRMQMLFCSSRQVTYVCVLACIANSLFFFDDIALPIPNINVISSIDFLLSSFFSSPCDNDSFFFYTTCDNDSSFDMISVLVLQLFLSYPNSINQDLTIAMKTQII